MADAPASMADDQAVVVSDYNGGLVVTWARHDQYWYDDARILAARLNATGAAVWPAGGIEVVLPPFSQSRPVAGGSFGTYLIAFADRDSTGEEHLRYQLLDHQTGGRLLSDAGQAVVSGRTGDAFYPKTVALSGHRTAVVWQERKRWDPILYYQILGSNGVPERVINGEPIAPNMTGQPGMWQDQWELCEDGSGGFFVTFVDLRTGERKVRLAHVNSSGDVVSADSGQIVWWQPGLRDKSPDWSTA